MRYCPIFILIDYTNNKRCDVIKILQNSTAIPPLAGYLKSQTPFSWYEKTVFVDDKVCKDYKVG